MNSEQLAIALQGKPRASLGRPASNTHIAQAENDLRVSFPDDLKEYLRRFGHIRVGSHELFGLGDGLPKYLDIVAMTRAERNEAGLDHSLVPLHNDGYGNLTCMRTGGLFAGQLVLWIHDGRKQDQLKPIASGLFEWIAGL